MGASCLRRKVGAGAGACNSNARQLEICRIDAMVPSSAFSEPGSFAKPYAAAYYNWPS